MHPPSCTGVVSIVDSCELIVDGVDGKRWHVALGVHEPGALPPHGAIIEAKPQARHARASDRTIAQIAAVNGGLYSDALHAADDPGASADYRGAHKRRLEALRRAGIVQRLQDGSFVIPETYLERAAAFEATRMGGARIAVKSWVGLETQITARAPTWLDGADDDHHARDGFAASLRDAKRRRLAFLTQEEIDLGEPAVLEKRALEKAAMKTASDTGRTYVPAVDGVSFEGTYERPVNLAQGRFALVTRAKEFTLIPWRAELERHRGRPMTVKTKGGGIEWTIGQNIGRTR